MAERKSGRMDALEVILQRVVEPSTERLSPPLQLLNGFMQKLAGKAPRLQALSPVMATPRMRYLEEKTYMIITGTTVIIEPAIQRS